MSKQRRDDIYTGNRFVQYTDERTGHYERDRDHLFHKYKPLRNNIFGIYKQKLKDRATIEELRSYIDEQFDNLVTEYDINGNVDMEGYLKNMLHARVKGAFVSKEHEHKRRYTTVKGDYGVEDLIDAKFLSSDSDLDIHIVLEDMLNNVSWTDLDVIVLHELLQEKPDSHIEKAIRTNHPGRFTLQHIRETIKDVKEYTYNYLQEEITRNQSNLR